MPAPSIEITIGDRGPSSPLPGDVSALFVVGLADSGPVGEAVEVRSLNRFEATFGDAVAYSHLYRSAEAYFREGGARMVVSRAVGPAATTASLDLDDSLAAPVLVVTAASPGDWAHALTVTVTTEGTDRRVVLARDGDTIADVTTSNEADVITALEATGLVTVTAGAGTWPIVNLAATALAGGNDDRAAITQTEWDAALAVLQDDELGVGSLAAPGITTAAMHEALLTHAATFKRFALLDAVDTATVATLTAAASPLRALGVTAGYGQMLAPWETAPGPGTTTVTIPPSGAYAGRMARADRENSAGPGQPAAGRFGLSRWSVDVTQEWAKADRDTLSEAGVTVIRNIRGKVQAYDGLTLANPDTLPQYAEANGMRVVLAIYSQSLEAIGQRVMQTIDGNRHILSAMEADLVGICQSWFARDALYGETSGDAFSVDTGPGVNPAEQLALRKIAAQIELRTSPFAATVSLLITKVASGDQIA